MSKVHVKTGDTVIVMSGKDKGKKGKVLAVSPKEGKIIVEKIISKRGFIRKNMLGARMHCTSRMVITPITGHHRGDELRIPWVVGVSQHKCEIMNILTRRMGYTIEQAKSMWVYAQVNYEPTVHEALKIIEKENPYGGIPVILGRNPSLRPGALQLFKATTKTDITDETASISPLVLTAPNADFDGDAKDKESLKRYFKTLFTHYMTPLTMEELNESKECYIAGRRVSTPSVI